MRIWSLHPKYLDAKGLVALWRETLLAKFVLEGKTKGYKHHPQLERFKKVNNPLECINQYLAHVYSEAMARGYDFNKKKIDWDFESTKLTVTKGQLKYESEHLLKKLKKRDQNKFNQLISISNIETHPLFYKVTGVIEDWEKIN
ncbi:MAG: pyrimidine dimer DNA glycosylase/endonuclease V [Ignavibacteriales bacterium]